MALVGGIGAGLFILIILWLLTLIVSLVLVFIPKARYVLYMLCIIFLQDHNSNV